MKHLLTAAICTAAMTTGAFASTVTIDFVALAAGLNPAFGNVNAGDYGDAEGQTFSFGDLDVTLSSSSNAYLDDLSAGRPAGLGVCSTGITSTGQCVVASDDNVTTGEFVTLTFSGADVVSLSDFVFNDANHNDISNSADTLGLSFVDDDGANSFGAGTVSFGGVAAAIAGGQNGALQSITFAYDDFANSADEFYLSSLTAELAAVPLPASVLLLGGAIGGLGLMRRRKAAA